MLVLRQYVLGVLLGVLLLLSLFLLTCTPTGQAYTGAPSCVSTNVASCENLPDGSVKYNWYYRGVLQEKIIADKCSGIAAVDYHCSSEKMVEYCRESCTNGCRQGVCLLRCGNKILETGEECDDGNMLNGDGCSASCTLEDADSDGILNGADNCPTVANSGQQDLDLDGIGDVCDAQTCGDGVISIGENCLICALDVQCGQGEICSESICKSNNLYDDFSGSTLDLTKWQETAESDSGTEFVSEHSTINGVYHTAQTTAENRAVTLITKKTFSTGDTFEYDIVLGEGSGNRLSRVYFDGFEEGKSINERYLDTRLARQGYDHKGFATSGDIGNWNGDSEVGSVAGTYHVKVEFLSSGTKIMITNPAGASYPFEITLPLPAKVGFSTKTGHDGIVGVDYDTVACTPAGECEVSSPAPSSDPVIGKSLMVVDAMGKEVGVLSYRSRDINAPLEQANEVVVFDTNIQVFMAYDLYTGRGLDQGVSPGNRQIDGVWNDNLFFETIDCSGMAYTIPFSRNPYTLLSIGDPRRYFRIPDYESINIVSFDTLHSKLTFERTNIGECSTVSEPKNGKTKLEEIILPSYPGPLRLVVG